jgi:hypothetical protein
LRETAAPTFNRLHWAKLREAGLLAVVLSPVVSLFANPLSVVRTLMNCRLLRHGQWQRYGGFSSAPAFLKLFYAVQSANLQRHGLAGTSDTLGGGRFSMRSFWYQSMAATLTEQCFGAVPTLLLGMSGWLLTSALWFPASGSPSWVPPLLLLLAASSTNFYGNYFGRQNYNALGWALFPAFLWALLTNRLLFACGTFLGIAFLSITVASLAGLCTATVALLAGTPQIGLAVVPGVLKILTDIEWRGGAEDQPAVKLVFRLLGAIGLHRKVKYRRPVRVGYVIVFAVVLAAFPAAILWQGIQLDSAATPVLIGLAVLPVGVFVVNQTHLLRFADPQSSMMFHLSISAAITMAEPNLWTALVFWLTNTNPLVALLLFEFDVPWKNALRYAPSVAPFDLEPFNRALDAFLAPLPDKSRAWIAFRDPGTDYNSIFAGMSTLCQALSYRADQRQIHVLPDWYLVMEVNHDGAPSIWGRLPSEVRKHLRERATPFAILSAHDGEDILEQHVADGFTVLTALDWGKLLRDRCPHSPLISGGGMTWYLVRDTASDVACASG